MQTAAGNLKRLTLELGGKSPIVICDDANLSRAIPAVAQTMFVNSGQVCAAGSRVYIARKIYDQVISGSAAVDRDQLSRIVVAIGDAALALGPELVSLEVNPLLVDGARIECLDALTVWSTNRGGS